MPLQKQKTQTDAPTAAKRRLSPEARREEIVQAAVTLFAETGFDGSTRDVARKAGITQPLLYRYFPSKESLIEAAYAKVFLNSWNPDWDAILADQSRSVQDRFQSFYEAYTSVVFEPVWLRLWYFALLRNSDVFEWYKEVVQEQILKPLVRERRIELGHSRGFQVSDEELEAPWLLHGGLLNHGLRSQIGEDLKSSNSPSDKCTIRQAIQMYMLISENQYGG